MLRPRSSKRKKHPRRSIRIVLVLGSLCAGIGIDCFATEPKDTSFSAFLQTVAAAGNRVPSTLKDGLALNDEQGTSTQPNALQKDSVAGPIAMIQPDDPAAWWRIGANQELLTSPSSIRFDLSSILAQTLQSSPQIAAVSRRTSIAYEKIVQQDAAFDPVMLLDTGYDRVNDPVGNTLTTGGPDRLITDGFSASGGIQKLTRLGTSVDLKQEIGTLQSNSQFFEPAHQGNSRLSLSITQPLLARSGRVYNSRLLTQASIDSHVAWQQMRGEIEQHLVDTFTAFWQLYARRCQLVQQLTLIERTQRVAKIVEGRSGFDSSPQSRIKVARRLAADQDRMIEMRGDVRRLQAVLKTLVGSDALTAMDESLELIVEANPEIPIEELPVRDCIVRGLEHRPDIRAATQQLSAAGLEINVTRNELKPRLDAVFDAYLAGLRGRNNIGRSLVDQYSAGGPGFTAMLQYNLPWGQRSAKSRYREARYRYCQRTEELRAALLMARREIQSAVIEVETQAELRLSKSRTLNAAIREETIATRRWEKLAGDGGSAVLVLEDLLENQRRRTDAEQSLVTSQTDYVMSLIRLQQAMGTLLIREGVEAVRPSRTSQIEVLQTSPISDTVYGIDQWTNPNLNSGNYPTGNFDDAGVWTSQPGHGRVHQVDHPLDAPIVSEPDMLESR